MKQAIDVNTDDLSVRQADNVVFSAHQSRHVDAHHRKLKHRGDIIQIDNDCEVDRSTPPALVILHCTAFDGL